MYVRSVISSFLLQDIATHDARLFEVREAFNRTLLLGFRAAYIWAYIAKNNRLRGPPGGPSDRNRRRTTINALVLGTCMYVLTAPGTCRQAYYKIKKKLRVSWRISSKLIFASCVGYFDRE